MSNPGFSVSELIQAVDWTIKLILDLNAAGDQFRDFQKDLETSRNQLMGLEHELQKTHHDINHRADAFKTLREDLFQIINDTYSLLQRMYPSSLPTSGVLSRFRSNLRWVLDGRYQGTVKVLQERIAKVERHIDREIQLLGLHYHRDAYEARKAEETRIESRSPLSSSLKTNKKLGEIDKETKPEPLEVVTQPQPHPGQTIISVSKRSPATAEGRPGPWVTANAPPSPPPSPPMPPSPNPPQRSMTSMTGTTLSGSTIRDAPSLRRVSTTSNNVPQFTKETLTTTGIIKVWFYKNARQDSYVSHKMKSLAILRDASGSFRGVIAFRPDGKVLKDEISTFWSNIAKHPLPVHTSSARDLIDPDGRAKNVIKFLRSKTEQASGPPVPKYYSFSENGDYRLFQTKVVGIQLLYWIEVKTIVSAWSKTTPLCENQVLQLWERGGAMSIQFLRNGKDRVYSHHLVSSLRIETSTARQFHLKLVFVPLQETPPPGSVQELEQRIKYLTIIFTDPTQMPRFLELARFQRS